MKILLKFLIVAAALWVAALLVDGVEVGAASTAKGLGTLLGVATIFGLVNLLLKPLVKSVGCAVYVLTLGLFSLIVNAGLLLLTSWVARLLNLPFLVHGFWAAFWGAIIISVTSWALSLLLDV